MLRLGRRPFALFIAHAYTSSRWPPLGFLPPSRLLLLLLLAPCPPPLPLQVLFFACMAITLTWPELPPFCFRKLCLPAATGSRAPNVLALPALLVLSATASYALGPARARVRAADALPRLFSTRSKKQAHSITCLVIRQFCCIAPRT